MGCITSGEKITVNGVFQYIILTVVGSKYMGFMVFAKFVRNLFDISIALVYIYRT